MPELPEVETVVRDIRPYVMGKTITGLVVMMRNTSSARILPAGPDRFYEGIMMETIQTVVRRGKYIIMPLSNNNVIVFHLGMTGRLLVKEVPSVDFEQRFSGEEYVDKHTHLLIEVMDQSGLGGPDLEISFNDPRMFGHVWLVEDAKDINSLDVPGLKDLGPDALTITLDEFSDMLKQTGRSVKALLLDQTKIAGVGNIYADEGCFAAKIMPSRKANTLDDTEAARLWFSVKSVLKEGIRFRGSSTSDYTSVDGSAGTYQQKHRVYQKTGMGCVECETPVSKMKLVGRSTHFCPSCQK